MNDKKLADNLYDGSLREIKMNRFGKPDRAVLRICALFEGMPVWPQTPHAFTDGRVLKLHGIKLEIEYTLSLAKEE